MKGKHLERKEGKKNPKKTRECDKKVIERTVMTSAFLGLD